MSLLVHMRRASRIATCVFHTGTILILVFTWLWVENVCRHCGRSMGVISLGIWPMSESSRILSHVSRRVSDIPGIPWPLQLTHRPPNHIQPFQIVAFVRKIVNNQQSTLNDDRHCLQIEAAEIRLSCDDRWNCTRYIHYFLLFVYVWNLWNGDKRHHTLRYKSAFRVWRCVQCRVYVSSTKMGGFLFLTTSQLL